VYFSRFQQLREFSMRVSFVSRLFYVTTFLALLLAPALADVTTTEAAKFLPDRIGDFRAQGRVAPIGRTELMELERDVDLVSAASRTYLSDNNLKFVVAIAKTGSDSSAYAIVSNALNIADNKRASRTMTKLNEVGTFALTEPYSISFYKGTTFVTINYGYQEDVGHFVTAATALARLVAKNLDGGTGEIPVLVKHLPDWETAQERAVYVVRQSALKDIMPNQPVLDAVSFDGGTEAVAATYDQGARLLIVEYSTPQFAFDGDAAITARIAGLRDEGKPVPSAYRRVGNYAVFVFDAPNEAMAGELVKKVKYEKDVRWLGENPYAIERANRAWLNMSTSVIVNTVKVTGLAIVICLGIGGIFGGWVFMRRRAQAALNESFSDAGGMMRLNLDEMNVESNASRLLGQGKK
jgi:hypothetical protein